MFLKTGFFLKTLVASLALAVAGGSLMAACAAAGTQAASDRLARIKASPQWRDGKFVNSRTNVEPPFFKTLGQWMTGTQKTVPDEPPPVVPRVAADFTEPSTSGLRITWLGHSTLLIEIDGYRILTDPVFSERASPFEWAGPKRFHPTPLPVEELPRLDAVVISHDHYDHLDERSIRALGDRVPLYAVPLGVGAHLERFGVPSERIAERDWWEEVDLGDVAVIATPARHFSGRSWVMADRDETLWAGWAVRGPRHRVYFSGDTAMFEGFQTIGERLGPFDAVMIETGAYNQLWADVHLGPEQAVAARRALGSGLYIPVHWGTFDLALHGWTEPVERLLVAANAAGVDVAIPRPGESVEPATPPELVRWWPSVPWQTAEMAPVVSSGYEEAFAASSNDVHGVEPASQSEGASAR